MQWKLSARHRRNGGLARVALRQLKRPVTNRNSEARITNVDERRGRLRPCGARGVRIEGIGDVLETLCKSLFSQRSVARWYRLPCRSATRGRGKEVTSPRSFNQASPAETRGASVLDIVSSNIVLGLGSADETSEAGSYHAPPRLFASTITFRKSSKLLREFSRARIRSSSLVPAESSTRTDRPSWAMKGSRRSPGKYKP